MNAYRWQCARLEENTVTQIAREFGIAPLLARCLVNRGFSDVLKAADFLEPKLAHLSDPFLIPGMDRAVDRLLQAQGSGERFVIFGDYDVDGVTSTTLLTQFFKRFDWHSEYYLPHRLEEGYGLSSEGIENCLHKFDVKLVLAVDCGSSAREVIHDLKGRGIEVIVLDHHQISDPAPPAVALVNPQLLDPNSPARFLCSAGLAFKLVHALLKRGRALGWPGAFDYDLRLLLDLVALGTIADLVPIRGENRILTRHGLARLGVTDRAGLVALKEVSGVTIPVTPQEVGFQLGPRLNAAGRLETALDALELLLSENMDRAQALAAVLDQQNKARQALEKKIADEAMLAVRSRFDPLNDFAIVEGHSSWHVGVVGIVASRVLREFHRPVIILGSDGSSEWRGSGRSIKGLDMAAALRQCGSLLLKHGGHAMAAGLTLASEKIAEFREKFNACARTMLSAEALQPTLRLDAEVTLGELTFPTLKSLERVEPTGQGNPPVQFAARGLRLDGALKRFGPQQKHLRFQVTDGNAAQMAVWWNCAEKEVPPGRFDLAFVPELNEFNGTVGIQLRLLDICATP